MLPLLSIALGAFVIGTEGFMWRRPPPMRFPTAPPSAHADAFIGTMGGN